MDLADLEDLLDEIRNGREESITTEWKRQWWNLDDAVSRNEFVKDIASMANANSRDDRVILVGVGNGGQVLDAPLPEDEANLQQRLQAITPTPHVLFKILALADGKRVSVIEIHEPFDKPYVTRSNNQNTIYVRQGSTTTTATRAMLDRWYNEGRGTPELHVLVEGQEICSDSVIIYPRPRHIPEIRELDTFGAQFATAVRGFETDPEDEADFLNRRFWLAMTLSNRSKHEALHVVADFEIEPVEDVRLWDDPPLLVSPSSISRWQTDPKENCYVDRFGDQDEVARIRQRVHRINPGTDESLVPLRLLALTDESSEPLRVNVQYRITDDRGERIKGNFGVQVVFDGTTSVKPKSRFGS